jgi:hypothetical protein
MKTLQLVVRFSIHPGKTDKFKQLAQKAFAVTRNEAGNLQYDYLLSADESTCVVLEKYDDSDAFLAHVVNLGEILGQMLAISEIAPEVYGNPSEALVNATAELNPTVYSYLGSK